MFGPTQVQLVDAPVLQILLEGHRAALLAEVKTTRPVEVDDGAEVARVPVEVILVVLHVELVAELQDLRRALGPPQLAQPRLGQSLQQHPGHVEPELSEQKFGTKLNDCFCFSYLMPPTLTTTGLSSAVRDTGLSDCQEPGRVLGSSASSCRWLATCGPTRGQYCRGSGPIRGQYSPGSCGPAAPAPRTSSPRCS